MVKHFLEISSERKNIKEVEELMQIVNSTFQLPEDEYNKLMIALTEIAINAIVHGNKENLLKKVRIFTEHDNKCLKINIFDEGEEFDIEKLSDPTDMSNIFDLHGRGIFIAKSLADEFYYKHHENDGNEFILIFNKK
jgi:serine/threonine-protein kinase RsbW